MRWNTITAVAMAAACLSFRQAVPFPNNDGHKPTYTALHPSATSTSDHSSNPSPTSSDVPSGPGRFIRRTDPEGVDACLQVNSPSFGTGTIGIGFRASSNVPPTLQRFDPDEGAVLPGFTKLRLVDDEGNVWCVDFGENPTDGSPVVITACDANAPDQNLLVGFQDRVIATASISEPPLSQCLDVIAGSQTTYLSPHGIYSFTDPYQASRIRDRLTIRTCLTFSLISYTRMFTVDDEASPEPAPTPGIGTAIWPGNYLRWASSEANGVEACLQVNRFSFATRTLGLGWCASSIDPPDYQRFYIQDAANLTLLRMVGVGTGNIFCLDLGSEATPGGPAFFNRSTGIITSALSPTPLAIDVEVDTQSQSLFIPPYGIYKPVRGFSIGDGREDEQRFESSGGLVGPPRQVRWPFAEGGTLRCLQVEAPGFSSRTLGLGPCADTEVPPDYQRFYFNLGPTIVQMRNASTNNETFCLDFGNSELFADITLETCDGSSGQQLSASREIRGGPTLEDQIIITSTANGFGLGIECARVRVDSLVPPPNPGLYPNSNTVNIGSCNFDPVTDVINKENVMFERL
ncbi:hypothetical protein QFC20_004978 [Naganishia adeliensis]|uniref:Uncharacterized protein n=1 Tax=Naganishia adeliensis TaxID=92952 RepID=A0ACC2VV49_9TREE|nr:hypothetical protein QFC20_004978 [Naganishia adeliensis]